MIRLSIPPMMGQPQLDLNLELPRERSGLTEYVGLLECHDWYFEFSDDPSVYARGRAQRDTLNTVRRRLDPDFAIWNKHCQKGCENGGCGV